jgi:hypothetical protein
MRTRRKVRSGTERRRAQCGSAGGGCADITRLDRNPPSDCDQRSQEDEFRATHLMPGRAARAHVTL